MALLALLAAQVTGAGRAETRLAAAQREGATLEAAADGAIYETIWHMMDGTGEYWPPGAMARVIASAAGPVQVVVTEERGKIDINQAPPALLQALLAVLGADRDSAKTVADEIVAWRTQGPGNDPSQNVPSEYRMDGLAWGPPEQEFETLEELKLVHGVTPDLYAALVPYLTLDLEQGPWQQLAPPAVLAAMDKARRDSGLNMDNADVRGPIVLRLAATIHAPGGGAFTRRVRLRMDGSLAGGTTHYRILEWDRGSA